jgi:hypothetical protein
MTLNHFRAISAPGNEIAYEICNNNCSLTGIDAAAFEQCPADLNLIVAWMLLVKIAIASNLHSSVI